MKSTRGKKKGREKKRREREREDREERERERERERSEARSEALFRLKLGRPVLVITDVGKDIDDTLALLYLAYLHQRKRIVLVGVVTTGGRNRARARATCAILESVHIPSFLATESTTQLVDGRVPVVPGRSVSCLGENVVYVEVDGVNFNDIKAEEQESLDTLSLLFIEHLLAQYPGELTVMGLGPLTDLAACCENKRFHSVYLQGQAQEDPIEPLAPSPEAFNFKCDFKAAEKVFASLAPHCPFILLGKHAAYTVGLTSKDFELWDNLSDKRLNMKSTVLNAIAHLKNNSPDVYARVFGNGDPTSSYLSRPYDPMLCVLLEEDNGSRFFKPTRSTRHTLIGASAANHGVVSPSALHEQLVYGIQCALRGQSISYKFVRIPLLTIAAGLFVMTLRAALVASQVQR